MNDPYAYRNDNLRRLGFDSYSAYLRSDLWASIRVRVLCEGTKCAKCVKRKATQVHHRAYDPATLRGDNVNSLTPLCGPCHRNAERPWDKQTKYDRYKAAGEVMFQKRHPTVSARAKLRRRVKLSLLG